MAQDVKSVLFVCLGNICRSPLAEGLFAQVLVERGLRDAFAVDSAGTGAWHAGSAPDPRSIAVALRYGVDISAQQARKIRESDFVDYDVILGMDRSNVDDLKKLAGPMQHKVHLFMEHALGARRDVPDPYYGGPAGFEDVYRMIRSASEALADKVGARNSASRGQASSTT